MRLDLSAVRLDFRARIDIIRALHTATRLGPGGVPVAPGVPDVSREARGLAIVLLYAAYEALLRATARFLLEAAVRTRVGNKRLQPGFQVAAAFSKLQSVADSKSSKLWRSSGLEIVNALFASAPPATIDETRFPDTGDNFKQPQLLALCQLFGLGDPAPVLRQVWDELDTIVVDRNMVAHGTQTATDVGRRYSDSDLTLLVDRWDARWSDFVDWAETKGRSRELYRRRKT